MPARNLRHTIGAARQAPALNGPRSGNGASANRFTLEEMAGPNRTRADRTIAADAQTKTGTRNVCPRRAAVRWPIPTLSPNRRRCFSFAAMSAESRLLARCLRGEADAWDELFDAHYAAAARFIFQVSSDFTSEDVEEICQETFLTVIKSLGSFQGNCQFQTWLFRVAANKAHDYIEKQRAAKRGGGQKTLSLNAPVNGSEPDGFAIDPPSSAPAPDRVLLQMEDAGLITRALGELGDPCREVIELRYFADLSYEEIAAELRLNPKTVSSRLSKCLDKLEGVALRYFPQASNSRERNKPLSV